MKAASIVLAPGAGTLRRPESGNNIWRGDCFPIRPLGANPALLLEAMQRGIKRTLMDLQHFFRNLTNASRDAPSVHRLERERPQNQEVEGALDQVGWLSHRGSPVDK
jgi:hypothetical protein